MIVISPNNSSPRIFYTPSVIILCAVIFAHNFLSSESSSLFIVMLGLLVMLFGKLQVTCLKFLWPLFGIFLIGVAGVFGHDTRDVLRDIAYALTPISLMLIGYWIANRSEMWPYFLKVMILCGFIISLSHLSEFALNPKLLTAELVDVRTSVGSSSGGRLVVLSLVLSVFQYRLGLGSLFFRFVPRVIILPALLSSFVLSYSRTDFFVCLVLSLSLWGAFTKINIRFMLTVVALVLGVVTLVLLVPNDGSITFGSKLANSLSEVTVANYHDAQDINDHWRGYEAYKAVESYLSGNALQLVLGQGFGALADLGLYMNLGGKDFRYIAVFHNGYAYILLKTGILGIALYLLFYISVIRNSIRYSKSSNKEQNSLARLMMGSVLSLVLIMFVIGGMAQIHGVELVLLLGYLVRRVEIVKMSNRGIHK